jgi:GTPase SAR1 family protein
MPVVDQFEEYEHVYKIIMIGSSFTGKTTLINRFVTDQFNN